MQFPQDPMAHKLMGVIHFQEKQFDCALDHLEIAARADKSDAEIYNLMGCIFLTRREYQQAHDRLSQAIALQADYIDAWSNLGLVYFETGHYQQALSAFEQLLEYDGHNPTGKLYHAICLEKLGDLAAAEKELLRCLQDNPTRLAVIKSLLSCFARQSKTGEIESLIAQYSDATMLFNIANICLELNLAQTAIDLYRKLEHRYPDKSALYNNLASAYDRTDRLDKAIDLFKKSIAENPEYIGAYSNLGRVLCDLNRMEEAEQWISKGLALDPGNANALINLGRVYNLQRRYLEARACYTKALQSEPDNATVLYNMGNTYHKTGDFQQASNYFSRCLTIDPDYSDAEYNLGINQLALGKFDTAWGHYFKRVRYLQHDEQLSPITPGLDYCGKRLYFCYSQGIGDELFFLRFLPWLKRQKVHVTYRSSPKLVPILSNISFIDVLLTENDPTPDCDYYFTVDDLPLVLGMHDVSQIPPPLNLLPIDTRVSEAIHREFLSLPRPFIGITWRAGTQVENRIHRSNQARLSKIFALEDMINLIKNIEGTVFILQRNPKADEIARLKSVLKSRVVDASQYNEDLNKILALLNLLDDSVCVSNTNVHLLAGIGKTANILVPHPPEWRWMDREGNSPWFPGMDTFRQSADNDWNKSLKRLRNKLNKYGSNKKA